MWPLRTIFYFGMFWFACVLALFNPIWGVVNYLLVYQMNPVDTWWGIPIADFGVRYSLFAIAFTLAGLLIGRRRIPAVYPTIALWEVGVLLLLAIAAVNTVIGIEYGAAAQFAFEKFWKMFVFVLILARMVTTRRNLRLVLWALVCGSFYLGYDAYTAPASSFVTGRLEQIGGADFSTTSGFSAHMSAMLPIIGVVFLTATSKRAKVAVAIVGAFAVNAIIMCRTRSAFIGLGLGSLVAFFWAPRVRRFRIHTLLVAGALSAYALTDGPFWQRMGTLTSREALEADPAAETRIEIWWVAARILADHPEGIGLGNFPVIIGHYNWDLYKRSSHNTVLVAFVELGVHGGLLFLALTMGSLSYAYRCSRMADQCDFPTETKMTAYGMMVACVTFFVSGLGTERFFCESYWWVLVLPLCLYRIVTREVRQRSAAPARIEAASDGFAFAPGGGSCRALPNL